MESKYLNMDKDAPGSIPGLNHRGLFYLSQL